MTGPERKAYFAKRRGLQKDVARKLKMSEWHVSTVIDGSRVGGPRVKAEIARRMRLPVDVVFPPDEASAEQKKEA